MFITRKVRALKRFSSTTWELKDKESQVEKSLWLLSFSQI